MEASRALQGEPSGLWQYSETSCWVRVIRRKLHDIQHNIMIIIRNYNIVNTTCTYYYFIIIVIIYYNIVVIPLNCHPSRDVALQRESARRADFHEYELDKYVTSRTIHTSYVLSSNRDTASVIIIYYILL